MHADAALARYARANGRVCVSVGHVTPGVEPSSATRLRLNPCEGVAMAMSVPVGCPLMSDDAKHTCVVEFEHDGTRTVHPPFEVCSLRSGADAAGTIATTEEAGAAGGSGPLGEFVLVCNDSQACADFMRTWGLFCEHCANLGIPCRVDKNQSFPSNSMLPAVFYNIDDAPAPPLYDGNMVKMIKKTYGH